MKIKQQILKLYTLAFFGSLNFTDGIWVLLMASRGFSLWEIGLAEGIFHAVSLLFEVPSGMLADSYGRRRILIFSQIFAGLSCLAMIFSNSLFIICLSMAFCAIGYNLASGTTEALRYDSLLEVGKEKDYIKISSWDSVIYSVTGAVCKLLSGIVVKLGYLICYGFGVFSATIRAFVAASLKEATPPGRTEERHMKFTLGGVWKNIKIKAAESKSFIKSRPISLAYMLVCAAISACTTMTGFIIQQHFALNGVDGNWTLGILLFIISIGGAVGARIAPLAARLPHRFSAPFFGLTCTGGLFLCSVSNPYLAALGGFIACVSDEAFMTITDMRLNNMFPSSDRATLVSVNSMCFSLIMVVLSPLYGMMSDIFGTGNSFILCGTALLAGTVISTLVFFISRDKNKITGR